MSKNVHYCAWASGNSADVCTVCITLNNANRPGFQPGFVSFLCQFFGPFQKKTDKEPACFMVVSRGKTGLSLTILSVLSVLSVSANREGRSFSDCLLCSLVKQPVKNLGAGHCIRHTQNSGRALDAHELTKLTKLTNRLPLTREQAAARPLFLSVSARRTRKN